MRALNRGHRPDVAVRCANKFVVDDLRQAPTLVDSIVAAGADVLALDVLFAKMTLDQVLDWLHQVADRLERSPGERITTATVTAPT